MKIANNNAVLVYVSQEVCLHEATRFDRFGDEVCADCGDLIKANATSPREGLYDEENC